MSDAAGRVRRRFASQSSASQWFWHRARFEFENYEAAVKVRAWFRSNGTTR